jgi:hypothetical protein
MYNPAMAPYVHHFEGNRRVWDYIESERLRAFDLSSALHCQTNSFTYGDLLQCVTRYVTCGAWRGLCACVQRLCAPAPRATAYSAVRRFVSPRCETRTFFAVLLKKEKGYHDDM